MSKEIQAVLKSQTLKDELSLIALGFGGTLAGLLLGVDAALCVGSVLALYGLWHLTQLAQLLSCLRNETGFSVLRPWGLWREVHNEVSAARRRERKRVRRLRRLLGGLGKTLDALPEALVALNSDGEVLWWNAQARRVFGLDGPNLPRRRLADLVDHPSLRSYLEAHDYHQPLTIEAPGKVAEILSISVLRNTNSRAPFLLIARDITRHYHANQSQHDFAQNVSHELRTPLTVLHGYLETLRDAEGEQSPKRRPILLMIEQTRRMQAVIQDLATLSNLEGGARQAQCEPLDLPELLRGILDEARELARNTRHEFQMSCDSGLVLYGDQTLLRAAISNLVFNAVEHTPIRTLVEIQWYEEAGLAVLEVRDNGAGIPMRHLSRLTERFYRVDSSRSRDSGSSGLGLAIVQQILELHEARLAIKSEEGFGSCFRCLFPANRFRRIVDQPIDEALN